MQNLPGQNPLNIPNVPKITNAGNIPQPIQVGGVKPPEVLKPIPGTTDFKIQGGTGKNSYGVIVLGRAPEDSLGKWFCTKVKQGLFGEMSKY
jgi:hypothetical protein